MNELSYLRSELYSMLAIAFGSRDPEASVERRYEETVDLLSRAAKVLSLPSLKVEAEELNQVLGQDASRREDAQDRIEMECGRLFGGWGGAVLHPYESVFRGESGTLMGEWALDVQALYAEDRLSIQTKELPDHLSVELEYMAYLCFREALAWEELGMEAALKYGARQRKFLREHLGQWIPSFCRSVLTSADHPFYLSMATVLRELVAWEEEQIAEVESREGVPSAIWIPEVDGQKCSLCEACVFLCPVGALRLERSVSEERLVRTGVACDGCGECAKRCPDLALKIKGLIVADDEELSELNPVLAVSPMVRCVDCGQPMGSEAVLERARALLKAKGESIWSDRSGRCPRCEMKGAIAASIPPKRKEVAS
jgi:TorA maturation chaperone TorD/NAD-dependent dihydropyrimidine dehydrogenase PreA subunit